MPKIGHKDLKISFLDLDRGVSQFELTLMITNTADRYCGTVEYNKELFKPETIERMFQSFLMVLEDAVNHPTRSISKLNHVNKLEFTHLVHELNQTQSDFPKEKCLHQLFEEQAEQTPDAIAVIYEEKSLTYFELNQRANILANQLIARGVTPEVRVGILMNKSIMMLEVLLAVLKSGGTYVPINTSFPKERVQFILEDSNVQLLLTDTDKKLEYPDNIVVLTLNDNTISQDHVAPNPNINIRSDQLINIIYTSGSTGHPKGVMVQQSSLVNLLCSMRKRPGISPKDTLLSVTAISFDIAALELFLPLIAGATLVIEGREATDNPLKICNLIDQYNVSIMQATPAVWQLLLDTGWKGKSKFKVLCGGEALTRKLADRLLSCVESLWNMYGPTETTVWSSVSEVQKGDAPITIGQPIGNTQLYILDTYLDPVSVGVIGELYIGGEGLARGYLNLPELTSKQFIKNVFREDSSSRLYKTGDRARYLSDYSIEILGRIDTQVKINGNRIELGEIDAVLNQHYAVKEVITITRVENSGEKRLVAYIVSQDDKLVNSNELRNYVRNKLPSYMVPAFFIQLESLPLTPNGKVNFKSLPLPEDTRIISGYVAPRNEEEQVLASIWQDVLGLEQVGIHDNFFELGGASIQSLRVLAKANMFGFRLSVEDIFEYQTVAELASKSMVRN
jgi:amino acid adenylation domain-containing protein